MQSDFGVAADWPLDYAELEPYYSLAEQLLGVAGHMGEDVRWRSQEYPLPAHELNYGSRFLQAGCEKLGLNLQANSLAILSRPYRGRPGCNYCNNCNKGCPRSDKGSVDVTFLPEALATGNCLLKSECKVLQLEAGANGRVSGIIYRDGKNRTHRLSPSCVVISCGAVETPRLLLNSANPHCPDGLANEHGQVGRHFMETLFWVASGLHEQSLGSHRGIPADVICWDYNRPDSIDGVVGGCRFSSAVSEAGFVGPVTYAQRVVGGWGHALKQSMRAQFGRVLSVSAIGESLPNDRTYIELDPQEKDEAGMPKARINSYLDSMALRRLEFMSRTTRDILFASGVTTIFEEYGTYDFFSSTHVFGGCRMGNDPLNSVVDRYGRSHRWQNLFIADASVFPSSGGGESPSLTIEALAIRTAEHIAMLSGENKL